MRRPGLSGTLFPLSFLGVVELGPSSVFLMVLTGLETDDDEEEDSFFLVTTASPVFFFTLSLFGFTPSVFTRAFTFTGLSFFVLSD